MKATFALNGVTFHIDAEEREELREGLLEREEGTRDWYQCFSETFEGLLCNGWDWLAPEDIGALTDAPILSNCTSIEDDGTRVLHGEGCGGSCGVFWFPDYQVTDPLEVLRDTGRVFFARSV